MKTITFYSYKGGTGRTLTLVHFARFLARLGFNVVAMDFDLEAPGLHYKIGDTKTAPNSPGVVDWLYAAVKKEEPLSINDCLVPVEIATPGRGSLRLISAGQDAPSEEYMYKLSNIDWIELVYADGAVRQQRFVDELNEALAIIPDSHSETFSPLRACIDKRANEGFVSGVDILLNLKEQIGKLGTDFLLIDSRTGITEVGRSATIVLADEIVCLMVDNEENIDGVRAVLGAFKSKRQEMFETVPGFPDPQHPYVHLAVSRLTHSVSKSGNAGRQSEPQRDHNVIRKEVERGVDLGIKTATTLHSDRRLEVRETRMDNGGHKDSVLLGDYLALFRQSLDEQEKKKAVGYLLDWHKNNNNNESKALKNPSEIEQFARGLAVGSSRFRKDLIDIYLNSLNFYDWQSKYINAAHLYEALDEVNKLLDKQAILSGDCIELIQKSDYIFSNVATIQRYGIIEMLYNALDMQNQGGEQRHWDALWQLTDRDFDYADTKRLAQCRFILQEVWENTIKTRPSSSHERFAQALAQVFVGHTNIVGNDDSVQIESIAKPEPFNPAKYFGKLLKGRKPSIAFDAIGTSKGDDLDNAAKIVFLSLEAITPPSPDMLQLAMALTLYLRTGNWMNRLETLRKTSPPKEPKLMAIWAAYALGIGDPKEIIVWTEDSAIANLEPEWPMLAVGLLDAVGKQEQGDEIFVRQGFGNHLMNFEQMQAWAALCKKREKREQALRKLTQRGFSLQEIERCLLQQTDI